MIQFWVCAACGGINPPDRLWCTCDGIGRQQPRQIFNGAGPTVPVVKLEYGGNDDRRDA